MRGVLGFQKAVSHLLAALAGAAAAGRAGERLGDGQGGCLLIGGGTAYKKAGVRDLALGEGAGEIPVHLGLMAQGRQQGLGLRGCASHRPLPCYERNLRRRQP